MAIGGERVGIAQRVDRRTTDHRRQRGRATRRWMLRERCMAAIGSPLLPRAASAVSPSTRKQATPISADSTLPTTTDQGCANRLCGGETSTAVAPSDGTMNTAALRPSNWCVSSS